MNLDANNLYGWAMSQHLPTGDFRWMTEKEMKNTSLYKYKNDSKKGCILDGDLEYPKEPHDLHNNYRLGPEQVKVTDDMLSEYCQKIKNKYGISNGQVHKLSPTLSRKINVFCIIVIYNYTLILD